MPKKPFSYEYPRPSVTVDIVVVTNERLPRVLLIQRKRPPFEGSWALPGGFIEMHEKLEDSARRELKEETGIEANKLVQLATFGDPGRDPRGRTISVVYLTVATPGLLKPKAADDAAAVGWFSLHHPPPLAFDHRQILAAARRRLRAGLHEGQPANSPTRHYSR
jgi:8-oxo-dGTP diphosphatase